MNHLFYGAVLILTALAAQAAPPQRHALIAGAGCETHDAEKTPACINPSFDHSTCDQTGPNKNMWNLFRRDFDLAARALTRKGNGDWKLTMQYDGDDWERPKSWPSTKATAAQLQAKQNPNAFTKEGFLAKLKAESEDKSLRDGGEFLLAVSTHGSTAPHMICLGNGDLLPISEIKPYLEKMKKNGVRVAVIDESCYSGLSVDELKDTGACVISGTSPNTMGGGSEQWARMFGLGLEPDDNAFKNHYYIPPLAQGPAVARDQSISAATAFRYSSLYNTSTSIPRTSDCELGDAKLKEILEGSAKLLRTEYGVQEATDDQIAPGVAKSQAAQAGSICNLERLHGVFSAIFEGRKIALAGALSAELTTLGLKSADIPGTLADLKSSVAKFTSLIAQAKEYQDAIDAKFVNARTNSNLEHNRNVQRDAEPKKTVEEKLGDVEDQASELKTRIFKDLRPLTQMACLNERIAAPKKERACADFELFPPRKGK